MSARLRRWTSRHLELVRLHRGPGAPLPLPLAEVARLCGPGWTARHAAALPTLVSKPRVLGLGLNLQAATRAVFSTLQDSYEEYYQAVKRANRVGSTRPLRVHIPVTEIERPMVDTVLHKARRVQDDAAEQQALFKENRHGF